MAKNDSESEPQELTPGEEAGGSHIGHDSANAEMDPAETILERERDANREIKQWADIDTECQQRCANTSYDAIVKTGPIFGSITSPASLPRLSRSWRPSARRPAASRSARQ